MSAVGDAFFNAKAWLTGDPVLLKNGEPAVDLRYVERIAPAIASKLRAVDSPTSGRHGYADIAEFNLVAAQNPEMARDVDAIMRQADGGQDERVLGLFFGALGGGVGAYFALSALGLVAAPLVVGTIEAGLLAAAAVPRLVFHANKIEDFYRQ